MTVNRCQSISEKDKQFFNGQTCRNLVRESKKGHGWSLELDMYRFLSAASRHKNAEKQRKGDYKLSKDW